MLDDALELSTESVFATSAPLVRYGEEADHVLVLLSGRASVTTTDGVELAVLGEGDLVGELSILAGGTRTADVSALEPVVARRFSRADFLRFLEGHPGLERDIAEQISRRLDEHHIASFVTRVLGRNVTLPFTDLRDELSWRWIEAGEYLYRAGDQSNSGYLVISGRIRIVGRDDDGAERTIGEVGSDDFIGESSIFETRPRRVSAQAIRDTLVAEITQEAAVNLLGRYPEALGPLLLNVGRSVGNGLRIRARRTAALLVTTDVPDHDLVARLQSHAGSRCAHISGRSVDALLSRPGAANANSGDPVEARLLRLLHETEMSHDHMFLEADREWSEWSARTARHADRLVAVLAPNPSPVAVAAAENLFSVGSPHAERVLVVVHPADTERPRATREWVEKWNIGRVLHMRTGSEADIARIARVLTGRSTGLVLGGGGARGFAHLGVYRAMHELGIPIDMVGGTSIGGAIGGAFAMALTPDDAVDTTDQLFRGLLDYTIPVVSLVKGEAITNAITKAYADWEFEDLWRPFFCMSTNLTRSASVVHQRGEMVPVIRASVSIPGVMPPVPWGEDLLVDGGVLNNLPVDVMRTEVEDGAVIAVNVAPPIGPRAKGDMALSVSGWEALRGRAGKGRAKYPGVTAMLMRTMIAGSVREQNRHIDSGIVDLYLDLDLRGISLLDFENVRPVAAAGYEAAMPKLEAWLASQP